MSRGAGSQPAGSTTASVGFITQPATKNPAVYPDPSTGAQRSGRYLDQKTRSFVSTTDGRFQGMGSVEQCAMIAWSTFDYSKIGPFTAGYENRARSAYMTAVRQLVNRQLLAVIDFDMQRFGSGGLLVRIRWRDLTTGIENTFESG